MPLSSVRFRRKQNRYRVRGQRNRIVSELDVSFRSQQELAASAQTDRHALSVQMNRPCVSALSE